MEQHPVRFQIKKRILYPKDFQITQTSKIYIPVSIGNKIFSCDDNIIDILSLYKNQRSPLLILIGDYLNRYNIMLADNLSEKDASALAQSIGAQYVSRIKHNLELLKMSHSTEIISTKHFYLDENFIKKVDIYKILYESDILFKRLVDLAIQSYVERMNKNMIVYIHRPKYEQLRYIFDELAIFEILIEKGYDVNLYPGNQPLLLKEIVQGKLVNIPEQLKQLKLIEIKYKPQKNIL